MIPNKTEIRQTGTLDGEDVAMTIDESSLGFIMGILSDLYSDRELAIIREYSTNARDSHRAAGQTRPIEITTPSAFSHYFKVKDYGVGMSIDDIKKIYSKYGASTKRTDPLANGILGLGCKSALAYTDQFTITAVKDGVKINVLISRTEDGGGSMSIVSEALTDEPNGVEVCVPVDKSNSFNSKAREFFKYWSVEEVLINESLPKRGNWKQISDTLWCDEDRTFYSKPIIVMGGVPYEVNTAQINLPIDLIAFVEMGEVDFPPNRESLKYTAKTKSTLNIIKNEYIKAMRDTVQKEITAAPDKKSALNKFENWGYRLAKYQMSLKGADFVYQGHKLEPTMTILTRWIAGIGETGSFDARITQVLSEVIVYDFDSAAITPYQKRKLKLWAEQQGKADKSFFFVKERPTSWWLEEAVKVSWKEVLALKLSKGTKEKPSYDAFIDGSFQSVTELDKSKPIFYSTKSEFKRLSGDGQRRVNRTKAMDDVQFVFVAENRIPKFLKLFPTAMTLKDGILKKAEEFKNSVSEGQWVRLTNDSYTLDRYATLDPKKLSDPLLADFVTTVISVKDSSELRREFNCIHGWVYDVTFVSMGTSSNNNTVEKIEKRYPLIRHILGGTDLKFKRHVYLYLEAVYETEIKETNEVHKG